ncbi:hypothetical protein [Variovorax sp. OV329]|nr:hypothetical protein [Variovorax sp. OV329]
MEGEAIDMVVETGHWPFVTPIAMPTIAGRAGLSDRGCEAHSLG